MRTIRFLAIAVAFFLLFLNARGQTPLDSLRKKFSIYRTQHIQEKLFIHLDRTVHLCGETLWFKVYSVNGTTHQPLSLSKVVYVEILSDSNESVVRAKVELTDGIGDGSLFLPATLNTGNYIVRGYTQWMKNYAEAFFFHQAITIINPFRGSETISGKQIASFDAQFMPEGGNLVGGLTSTVGFRVTDTSGKGIDFNGALTTAQGDTVARFSPAQFGIGTFELTPSAGEIYNAVIRDRTGQVKVFPFPKVYDTGYSLHVERTKDEIRVNVQSRLPDSGNLAVFLFVHTRNQIISSSAGTLVNGKLVFTIPASKVREGISHITLFDAALNPVCERLIFTAPDNKLIITPKTNAARYANREEVSLTLDVTTETQSPETASLSVSVYKVDSLPSFHQQTISSYLLLSSDLQGQIESPQTYLRPGMEESIDRLMLTHGWRRFRWDDLFTSVAQPKFLPEIMGVTISGKLTDGSGKPAPNVQTFLSLPSRNSLFFTTNSNRTGQLNFLLKNVYGAHKLIFQTNFSKDSLNVYTFKPDDPFVKTHSAIRPEQLKLASSLENILIEKSIGLQVDDIFKQEHGAKKFRLTDSTAFYGKADETYLLDDYTRFSVMEEVMREYVPGVLVTKKKGEFFLRVHDIVNHGTFYDEPLILMDGVPIFDTDKLMAIDPLKVRKLEAVTKAFFHGQSAFAGIVSFTTYKGDLAGFEPHPGSVTLNFEGLQFSREFYQPRYETQEAKSSREPDARNLLMWAPRVTVVNGKAELRFYTSDQTGYFQIEVEGLSRSGRMGSTTHSFWVGPLNK